MLLCDKILTNLKDPEKHTVLMCKLPIMKYGSMSIKYQHTGIMMQSTKTRCFLKDQDIGFYIESSPPTRAQTTLTVFLVNKRHRSYCQLQTTVEHCSHWNPRRHEVGVNAVQNWSSVGYAFYLFFWKKMKYDSERSL